MSGLTFITSIVLILTFILDIKKHSFPENIPLWISIAAMGFAVGFLMGVIVGYTPVICDSIGWCKTQGTHTFTVAISNPMSRADSIRTTAHAATFLVYFQFGLAGWMTVLAFNVFLVFTLKIKKKKANRLHLVYHVFAWGIGIPVIIVGLAVDRFDYIPPQLICFISAEPDGWPQLGLYTFPIFTLCALTMFFWLAIIWRIWRGRALLSLFVITFARERANNMVFVRLDVLINVALAQESRADVPVAARQVLAHLPLPLPVPVHLLVQH